MSPGEGDPGAEICARYWQLRRFVVPSRSRLGAPQSISGFVGPLLVRVPPGDLSRCWPGLVLGAEFHLGKGRRLGQGRFVPSLPGPVLDRRLEDPATFLDAWTVLSEKIEVVAGMDPLDFPGEEAEAAREVAEQVWAGRWRPAPVEVVAIPKASRPAKPEGAPDTPPGTPGAGGS